MSEVAYLSLIFTQIFDNRLNINDSRQARQASVATNAALSEHCRQSPRVALDRP